MKVRVHRLKSWPPSFNLIESGIKPFDLRKADRDYRIGDVVELNCFNPELNDFMGGRLYREITAIERVEVFDGNRLSGLHVILGYRPASDFDEMVFIEPGKLERVERPGQYAGGETDLLKDGDVVATIISADRPD